MSLYTTICITLMGLKLVYHYMGFTGSYNERSILFERLLVTTIATIILAVHISGDYFEVFLFSGLFFVVFNLIDILLGALCVLVVGKLHHKYCTYVQLFGIFMSVALVPVVLYITLFLFEAIL